MTEADGLLGEIDWKLFAECWSKAIVRISLWGLIAISISLSMANMMQRSPEDAEKIAQAIEFSTVVGVSINLLNFLFIVVMMWSVYPMLISFTAFKPLIKESKS